MSRVCITQRKKLWRLFFLSTFSYWFQTKPGLSPQNYRIAPSVWNDMKDLGQSSYAWLYVLWAKFIGQKRSKIRGGAIFGCLFEVLPLLMGEVIPSYLKVYNLSTKMTLYGLDLVIVLFFFWVFFFFFLGFFFFCFGFFFFFVYFL